MKKVVDERLLHLRRILERALKMKKFRGWSPERFLEYAYQAGRRDPEPEPRVLNVFISHGCKTDHLMAIRTYLDTYAATFSGIFVLGPGASFTP